MTTASRDFVCERRVDGIAMVLRNTVSAERETDIDDLIFICAQGDSPLCRTPRHLHSAMEGGLPVSRATSPRPIGRQRRRLTNPIPKQPARRRVSARATARHAPSPRRHLGTRRRCAVATRRYPPRHCDDEGGWGLSTSAFYRLRMSLMVERSRTTVSSPAGQAPDRSERIVRHMRCGSTVSGLKGASGPSSPPPRPRRRSRWGRRSGAGCRTRRRTGSSRRRGPATRAGRS